MEKDNNNNNKHVTTSFTCLFKESENPLFTRDRRLFDLKMVSKYTLYGVYAALFGKVNCLSLEST